MNEKKLIRTVEEFLDVKIEEIQTPPQGMDSKVLFVVDQERKEYVIKLSEGALVDAKAYELLAQNDVKIPVPKLFGMFDFDNKPVIIMERIQFPLLESIPVKQMSNYISSMIKNLKLIHKVKSQKSGFLNNLDSKKSWKEHLLSKFNGTDSELNWEEISNREGIDKELVLSAVEKIRDEISNTIMIDSNYSLIHTDFNQRNLFVDTKTKEIAGIIDWGEAMFGDPIFDFARVRMYIWHFDLGQDVVENYYNIMNYTESERHLDNLYWFTRVVEYLAYYSEELNEFNLDRINMHQKFLRKNFV
ncbi:TPA: aminoglycoside phosphotransferase family protein [Candidatus Dojkabacteria bacterium]|uniref:Aminoglycoside phosphotransferase family protein n=1 Tax=Candidatus Dojkabacteria bacterium TaxID=2099670 RepID=A0A832R8X9_9BACT|nr:aminoglycoside phosphotransferase family protein [Candidatus Dojkabacteria bacterium]